MKKIKVVAAVLHKNGTFLGTQRGYGEFEGGWEFPGGKIETGGEIQLREHKSARWMNREQLDDVEWLPADRDVVKKIKSMDIDSLS